MKRNLVNRISSPLQHLNSAHTPLTLIIFAGSLALYTATVMPDVLPADSGEFQRVAATADVAHPPGYPLYAMLGWLFTRLPLGATPAWRVNLLSAVTAAATLTLVFRTAYRLTDSVWGGLASALTLGSATTFWATATKASIRPLTAFFTALCLHALIRYRTTEETERVGRFTFHVLRFTFHVLRFTFPPSRSRHLTLFALALSLGLTHHASLIFPGVVFVLYLALVDPALLRQPRRWIKPGIAFLIGLSVLIYLPLRGGPELTTLSGFLDHVLARGFRGDMFALSLIDRLVLLPTLLRFQFNPMLVAGALLGGLLLLWRDRKLALLLIGSFLVHIAVTLTYDAPQTVEYLMPAYVPLALLVGTCAGGQVGKVAGLQVGKWVVVIAVLVGGTVNLTRHWPSYRTLSQSRDARTYAEGLLRDAPEDAVILANWHWFTPLRYLQRVEGQRPDVTIEYVYPRGEPLAETWVQRIEAYVPQHPVVVVRYFQREYDALPYRFEPLHEAFLVRTAPRRRVPDELARVDITLGEQVQLLGYRLDRRESKPACPLVLTLAWSPTVTPTGDVALFAQLIGPEGQLWSAARDRRQTAARLAAGEIIVERFTVYPLLHTQPGDYKLVVGAYRPGEPGAPRLTTTDGADAVPLETVQMHPATTRPVTQHPRFVRFAGGPTLIGVDFEPNPNGGVRTYLHWAGPGEAVPLTLMGREDALFTSGRVPALARGEYATLAFNRPSSVDRISVPGDGGPRRWNLLFTGVVSLPAPRENERYVPLGDAMVLTGLEGPSDQLEPGSEVSLPLRIGSQRVLERDYIVSAALTGLQPDGTWAWRDTHDTVPALGAIPTLKWIRGSAILDPHRLTVPGDASSDPAQGSLVVYDHFTQAPLPPLDERLAPAVPLGTWSVAVP